MTRAQIHVEPSATESFIEKYQHRPQYTFEFEWRKNSAKNARDGKLGSNRKKKGFLPTKAFSFPGGLSATDVLFDSPIKNLSSEFNLVYLYTSPLHQHAGCPLQAATRQRSRLVPRSTTLSIFKNGHTIVKMQKNSCIALGLLVLICAHSARSVVSSKGRRGRRVGCWSLGLFHLTHQIFFPPMRVFSSRHIIALL
jgi:hypothetical protein